LVGDDEALQGGPRIYPPWAVRGHDIGRVQALSDGVFAFAMTLLVLTLMLPVGVTGGGVAAYVQTRAFYSSVISYVIAFFLIGMWWRIHVLVFDYVRAFDSSLIRLNLMFLVFIAIDPFVTQLLTASGSAPLGAVAFAVVQIAAGGFLVAVWSYAASRKGILDSRVRPDWVRHLRQMSGIMSAVFALSIPLAFLNPEYSEVLWVAGSIVVNMLVMRRKFLEDPEAPHRPGMATR
jgi:uncharacterized membrane protein